MFYKKISVNEARDFAEKYIGKQMISYVKMGQEYIFQYDTEGFDPFVAVNIKTGNARNFSPAENPGRYFRCANRRKIF